MTKQQLRARRKKLSLTQVELARRLGVGWRTYARWEGEGKIPDMVALALRQIEQGKSRKKKP